MGIITKKVVIKTTVNQELQNFESGIDRIRNKKIISISTRTDGKTDGKLTVVNEAKLKTVALKLKDPNGLDIQDVSLSRVLQLSSLGNGYGLQVNSMLDFNSSSLVFNDPTGMTTGEAIELVFECEE